MTILLHDLLRWITFGLKPPVLPAGREPTEEERCKYLKQNNRQKHAVAYVLWALMLSFSIYFLWARGSLVEYVGPGFAYAQDVEQKAKDLNDKVDGVARSLNKLVQSQLRADLREARRLHCLAKKDGNAALIERYAEDLEVLEEEYHATNNRDWNRPRCEDI